MKILLSFLFLLPVSHAAITREVVAETSEEIHYGKHDGRNAYYTEKNNSRTLVAYASSNHSVESSGGKWVLYKSTSEKISYASGKTPFKNPPVRMTKETCEKKDLSAGLGPVRDQTADTCYAHNAADLISYGQDKTYSPMAIAALVKTDDPKQTVKGPMKEIDGFNTGSVLDALQVALDKGACPEEVAPSTKNLDDEMNRFLNHFGNAIYFQKEIEREVAECWQKNLSPMEQQFHMAKVLVTYKDELWDAKEAKKRGAKIFPTLAEEDFDKAFKDSKTSSEYLRALYERACKGKSDFNLKHRQLKHYRSFEKEPTEVYEHTQAALLDQINQDLDAGFPVSVYLYSHGLLTTTNRKDEMHGLMVAGRQWDEKSGQCLYLAKNSWGPKWKPGKDVKAKPAPGKPGYALVSEKALLEHSFQSLSLH